MDNQKLYRLLAEDNYHGFTLQKTHFVSELGYNMWILSHETSGAVLAYIDSPDTEKSFSLSFRLSPSDDTGVDHILEHTLLCGSQKYKVKSWGGDGLLSSFYGAFTMRDSSMYPVSSPDEASFQNLVRLYTDAVFAPLACLSDLPMSQEGWHYQYDRETDELSYSGIVYSEMKASYEMPEFILSDAQIRAAFPDTSLAFNIGGDPACIPQLTYKHFLAEYHRIFTPDNCLIYVYGNTDLSSVLDTLLPYLDPSRKSNRPVVIKGQPGKNSEKTRIEFYPISSKISAENRDFISLQWVIPQDRRTVIRATILTHLLKKQLVSLLPGCTVTLDCLTDLYWPMITLVARNVHGEDLPQIKETVFNKLKDLIQKGFSREDIEAAASAAQFAFDKRLSFVPRGIDIGIKVTGSWAHHKAPWDLLEFSSFFDELEQEEDLSSCFTELTRQLFLENSQYSQLILKADPSLSETRREEEHSRLLKERKRMSDSDLSKVISLQERLREYQYAPDSPQLLSALPKTNIEELEEKAPVLYPQIISTGNDSLLFVPADSSTAVMSLYYDLSSLSPEDLSVAGIIALLFGKLSCEGCDKSALHRRIATYTDEMSFSAVIAGKEEHLYAKLQWKFLPRHSIQAQELIFKMLCTCDYTDKETIREILAQYLQSRAQIKTDTCERLKARWSACAFQMQHFSGREFADYVQSLLSDFDEKWPSLQERLQTVSVRLFDGPAASVSLWCAPEPLKKIKDSLLFSVAKKEKQVRMPVTVLPPENELFACDDSMYYMTMGGRLENRTAAFLVSIKLAQNFVVRQIREIGGAYTVSVSLSQENDLFLLSARDPHLGETLETFCRIPDCLIHTSEEEIRNAVISAASAFYQKTGRSQNGYSAENQCDLAVRNYFNGMTPEKQQTLWEDLKRVTAAQIQECIPIWENILSRRYCCAVAAPDAPGADLWFIKIVE